MHILLTGEIQTGKSTALARVLSLCGCKVGGFRTVADNYAEDGSSEIFILGASESKTACCAENRVARRNGHKCVQGYTAFPHVFDKVGSALLRDAQANAEIILMDEVGFMESDALQFQATVMECLDGDIPVIGVVRNKQTAFLDQVRSHPKVLVLEVRQDNREEIPLTVMNLIKNKATAEN